MKGEAKLNGVHPDLVRVVRRAALMYGGEFKVTEGLRTIARQRQLKADGKSKTLNSRHLTGHAVDISPIVDGQISWDKRDYAELGKVMKSAAREEGIPIEWGGDWGWDFPHWQLPWKKYPKLQKIEEVSDEPPYKVKTAASSRVVQGSTLAGGGGLGFMAEGGMELRQSLEEGHEYWSSGDVIKIVIGAIVFFGALYALYARWDDAGRPLPDFLQRRIRE